MLTVSYDIVPIVFMEDDFGDLILNLILNIIFKFLLMKRTVKYVFTKLKIRSVLFHNGYSNLNQY